MYSRMFKLFVLLAALSLVFGSFQTSTLAQVPLPEQDALSQSDGVDQSLQEAELSHRLIVELESLPLANYLQSRGIAPLTSGGIDLSAAAAQTHLAQIEAEQAAFVQAMTSVFPAARVDTYINEFGNHVDLTYQLVFNGMVIDTGNADPQESRRALLGLPGVKAVYFDRAYYPTLYSSVPLINAPDLWNTPRIGGQENAGRGIKVASMDGGIHKDAPMFDGTGFSYPFGFPENGLGYTENNNGKIIASRVYFRAWDPPAPGDDTPWPGALGTSHGVHTAGTAAGNPVTANYLGASQAISGVAPAAWVMSYRVFYTSVTGRGSFYTAEGVAALEDIVRDGADVLNNSWGAGPSSAGGAFDALDQALINAANAGVFISMSAGNAGPGTGTLDHPSAEYISVAASTTSGTFAAGRLSVSGPGTVPAELENFPFAQAGFGEPLPLAEITSYNYVWAGDVGDGSNLQGCNEWTGQSFTGLAVLIMRGTCEFGVKVLNAEKAGAEFVVVYNNPAGGDGLINMAPGEVGNQVTIGSVFVGNTAGEAMADWAGDHGEDAEFEIDTTAYQVGNEPDFVINFSSRGPGVGNVAKPDILAPGVNILSQGYAPGATGEARHLGFGQVSGTSMASPHVAGGAALLRQYHPSWPNEYIKSALMTTAKYIGIYNEDETHAQPLDMGAGRLDLARAHDPGVILDPPSLGYGLVTLGESSSLTLMVTSVASTTQTYSLNAVKVSGTPEDTVTGPLPGFTITPATITLTPGQSVEVTVAFNSTGREIGDNQGYVVMKSANYDAHFPVWARVRPETTNEVLVIDNDASTTLGLPDYLDYYTDALDELGITYDVWNADANYGGDTTIPHAAVLSAYPVVIYFTGDNFYPDGTFTVSTPLTELDMDRLTEYANSGGILIAMGQDLSSVLQSATQNSSTFLYGSVLGGSWLQDSVTDEELPEFDIVPLVNAPPAFRDIVLNLRGEGDGAGNQNYIDEIQESPDIDPDSPDAFLPYNPIFRYPGRNNLEAGIVGIVHRDQPTLERAGISYFGRSIYTTFGLEGVDNVEDYTTRAELLNAFLSWAYDEPSASISVTSTNNPSKLTTFEASLTSPVEGVEAVSYRWDFGDGSPFTNWYPSEVVGHIYDTCGLHTVRVEVMDSWGNHTVEEMEINITQCQDESGQQIQYRILLPIMMQGPTP